MKFAKLWIFFIVICHSFFIHAQTAGSFQEISGSPFAAGTSPRAIAYSPLVNDNLFAAAPNSSSNNVTVYSVDTTTGAFTTVGGSPFDTGSTPFDIAFSPFVNDNLFAAISNSLSNNVWVYSVDTTTGAFTPVAGSPFAAEINPGGIAFSPLVDGNLFAAVVNILSNNVSVYQVDTTTGVFTQVPGSPFAVTGIQPIDIAFSPLANSNLFAAIANPASSNVEVYSVDTTTGAFTPVAGSPFAAETTPIRVAFSPLTGENVFAAVTNQSSDNVSVYNVDTNTGVFTPVTGSPFAAGTAPLGIAYSPFVAGSLFAAVTNQSSDNVSVYNVDTGTGAFTPVTGSPFATGDLPVAVAYSPLVNDNLFAAVSNQTSNNISVYNVTLPPTVTSINPSLGPIFGGTNVTITGTNFTGATDVSFGGTPATSFIVDNDTQITAVSPPGFGTVDVTVTTPAGTSATSPADQFTYIAPPTILFVNPSQGPTTGGTIVTIMGMNFTGATAVFFGATPALSFNVDNSTQITATSPPGTGTVDITVTTPSGTSPITPIDQFTYIAIVAPPTVTNISPSQGPTTGGTAVTITGTNFTGATAVFFGATPATSFIVNSDTQITAVSPPGTGTVDVTVTTPSGTSATSPADQFTYVAIVVPPTVTSINPFQGPTTGGTAVTITGTNFTGATAVFFGATPATSFIVNSDTQIIAVSPPGTGTVDVTVTTSSGTSAISPADQFTYIAVAIPPTVTNISPSQGPTTGNTIVIITGTNFTGASAIFFGTTPAISFIVDSDTQITAVSPPGTGTVDVTVTTPAGTSATSPTDQFTYIGEPLPPRNLQGCKKIKVNCQFSVKTFNILTWKEPSSGSPVVAYQIYRDQSLTRLVGEVSSDHNLRFKKRVRRIDKNRTYYVVSVNEFGNLSEPSKVKVKDFCGRGCCHHWVHHIKKCLKNRLLK